MSRTAFWIVALVGTAGLLLFALDAEAATVVSAKSGKWGDEATWSPAGVPGTDDRVDILGGHSIQFDVGTASIKSLTVGGTLSTPDANPAPGEGPDAASIRIEAEEWIVLSGPPEGIPASIQTGKGMDGPSDSKVGLEGEDANAAGTQGGKGGNITLISQTDNIELHRLAIIAAGNGGLGGPGLAQGGNGAAGEPGGNALASGGNGGNGGSISISCPQGDLVLLPPSMLFVGDGGSGGAANGVSGGGGAGNPPGSPGSATVNAGNGGESGQLQMSCQSLNGQPTVADSRVFLLQVVRGGKGGEPGTPFAGLGNHGAGNIQGDPCKPASVYGPSQSVRAGSGGSGLFPVSGKNAAAIGGAGLGSGKGGFAFAFGGNGGNTHLVTLTLAGNSFSTTIAPGIANGGRAEAHAGAPGANGGSGGDAFAWGGHAGSQPAGVLAPRGGSGLGGDASAVATNGAPGDSCCAPIDEGQPGGNGGSASATGGNSNDQAEGPNNERSGGLASALAGNGGRGGDGVPRGEGGDRGVPDADGGEGTMEGAESENQPSDGSDGEACKTTQCSDGHDNNDLDDAIDLADPGCADALDTDETSACEDGEDNDLDERQDLDDPGCTSYEDDSEVDPPPGGGGSVGGIVLPLDIVPAPWTGSHLVAPLALLFMTGAVIWLRQRGRKAP